MVALKIIGNLKLRNFERKAICTNYSHALD